MKSWNILYRGSLSSCNYSCDYCPFAKTKNTKEELESDRCEVERFVDWVTCKKREMSILFTPWGEALYHRYYRNALIQLSRLTHVRRVCIQTNLSAPLDDLAESCTDTLRLWATFHPSQTTLKSFAQKCRELLRYKLKFSVGIVGLKQHLEDMEQLRGELPEEVYLWVNAYKREGHYYDPSDLKRIQAVDPHFYINNERYQSFGKACTAGSTSFSVNGQGLARPCHFVSQELGNIYDDDFDSKLSARLCPAPTCGCYIGYIHRPELNLEQLYGDDLFSRIPRDWAKL